MTAKHQHIPRILLAALKGGAGKTLLTMGIVAAFRKRGLKIAAFKKGPDYIDSGWLAFAAGSDCRNLDAYLCDKNVVRGSFIARSFGKDLAVVEGNRGLFDGVDALGSYSTAELAKLLAAPVILIVDATKVTRTAAAMVLGCQRLDPEVDLRGVILNRVAGQRHERILRDSIEQACAIPVLGSIRKLDLQNFPQRHLGLLPLQENPKAADFVDRCAEMVAEDVDLGPILEIAATAPNLRADRFASGDEAEAIPFSQRERECVKVAAENDPVGRMQATRIVRIGVIRDSAFQFYYPENLEALADQGAEIVEFSALEASEMPAGLDGLYIGGGFPETHAERLAVNDRLKESLRKAIGTGLPVYAECGGLMYLSRSLRIDDRVYPMVRVFDVDCVLERKPQGHGYIQVIVEGENPFYSPGTVLTGHEFHYSYLTGLDGPATRYVFRVTRGYGMDGTRDGITVNAALGTYVHVHALGEPRWATGIVSAAERYRAGRRTPAD